ncbi:leucine-rich repeat and coiled-coil domain-containing protein 1 [Nematostella vectensis]|uniref:leucine-rich repeat and coiled-coil domain-containing protein 1 n=1 Tax=Nematostella vectensis TaxID=45351 RepID=UPI00138FBF8A|nr:leucine-rich repeat and coiled-coil domain-containing protein 1 [Nematostella vectensis]
MNSGHECLGGNCIKSPPKPTRVLTLESGLIFPPQIGTSNSLQETRFSLPNLAVEVVDGQKQQENEISELQTLLNKLKNELLQGKKKVESTKAEITSIDKKICVTQEEIAQTTLTCQEATEDLEGMIAKGILLSNELEDAKRSLDLGNRSYERYVEKMAYYCELVSQLDEKTGSQQKISVLITTIKELKNKVHCLEYGEDEGLGVGEEFKILQAENKHLEQQLEEKTSHIDKCKGKMELEREKQQKLKRESQLLNKRNHAQMTRLKRQLQEANSRSRHWADEACKLEMNIAQLRRKLEE